MLYLAETKVSGVLTGCHFGTAVQGPYQSEKRSGCGHMMISLNVEAFMPPEQFHARMAQLITNIKAVPTAEGFEQIFYPGELEAQNAEKHLKIGLTLPRDTVTGLKQLGEETEGSYIFFE